MTDGGDRRLAAVTRRFSSLEGVDRLPIEYLAHQAEPLVQVQLRTICCGDAGRLLPPMLERVQSQVGEPANRLTGRVNADHPALLAWAVRLVGRLYANQLAQG